ncbi:MAG: permease-like cell division protein FtsX [Bacteroidales bacterium]|nr:permease-like cell division protein FtsX [Bacteroidales bacterium]
MANRTTHRRHNSLSATLLGMTLALFLLGILMVIEYHSYRLTHDAQERITYKVDLVPDVDDAMALHLRDSIAAFPYVKHVDYISREKAAEIFSEDLGEDFIGFIGYNPLYPSLMVNFRVDLLPDNSSRLLDNFCSQIGKLDIVTGVAYQENVVNELREVFYNITWFLIVFGLLLFLITIILIDSLIRISLQSERETLRTMRMVGAGTGFITRPFVGRSIAFGAIGAAIAIVLLAVCLKVADLNLAADLLSTTHLPYYAAIAMLLLLLSMAIAWLSTTFAVHKQLKIQY